ncbi:hypothetical protein SZ64_07020 [Erythrobacter sp. SG61-1L]|uniref:hypothetical protein n=1 Tax=Erythrobacter sp. SG61-1L TaxID=1603897 RepID=UPI0006C8ECA8|nr:hypothetical protein [Erythrobacter sp. SG61-1L]KPL67890.1 hypothetical protein SZ64_07020 [Erythrobacter sp. SG61-1L]
MNSFAALFAPLALLLGTGLADAPADHGGPELRLTAQDGEVAGPLASSAAAIAPALSLDDSLGPQDNAQVRIEQSVTIRISPRAIANQSDLLAQLPQGKKSSHVEERKFGDCVSAQGIAGVATTADDRLLLFMRDRKVISVALEKACSARDFYSGFYVQRTSDGMLCVKRDKIHSRAGSKCALKQFRQLVAVRE